MYEIIIDYERQLSPSSPIVCAEFEIIEEQLDNIDKKIKANYASYRKERTTIREIKSDLMKTIKKCASANIVQTYFNFRTMAGGIEFVLVEREI